SLCPVYSSSSIPLLEYTTFKLNIHTISLIMVFYDSIFSQPIRMAYSSHKERRVCYFLISVERAEMKKSQAYGVAICKAGKYY
ncbi:MAG: hypothetical protein JW932_05875, partial [Deltaproteobacteria bacterium]|nr:hypothetical protein [Deltaproteobacteria bacterium]